FSSRRRHTRWPRDWSSDVCSSDLCQSLSLAAIGLANHPVAQNGVRFLVNAARPDGSWAIDSNLSTWVTTLAINALATAGELENRSEERRVGKEGRARWWQYDEKEN